MDCAPSPWGMSGEGLGPESPIFDGSDVVETTDGSFFQLSQASHLFHLTFLGDDNQPSNDDLLPAVDRPDIDDAMVDALRHAMVHEGGLPDRLHVGPVRQGRPDIDSALVEALARATVGDPELRDE